MNKCDCYFEVTDKTPLHDLFTGEAYHYAIKKIGRCNGTREQDICSCNGDREKAKKERTVNYVNMKEDLKYYLENNEENGVVYIPKFAVEKMISEIDRKTI